jgi:purine-binding chemotaxis protein CheW
VSGGRSGAEGAAALLKERAAKLARAGERTAQVETAQYISFELGRETYALESGCIRNVFRITDLSVLPGAQPPVYAVTNWRGMLLTLLDLRGPLGVGQRGITDLNHALVAGREGASFGVLSGRLRELLRGPLPELHAVSGAEARHGYVEAVTSGGVLILNAKKLLEDHG